MSSFVEKTLQLLEAKGLRQQFGVMVGGAAANPQLCERLGAFYGTDANAAVDYVRQWQQAHRH